MKPMRGLLKVLGCLLLVSCGGDPEPRPNDVDASADAEATIEAGLARDANTDMTATDAGTEPAPNILLLIADDLGVDSFGLYGDRDGDGMPDDGRTYASTPNLDRICTEGVRFTRAWSAPICSPTRATILTGRYGFRTGVGTVIGSGAAIGLDEPTLPRIMAARGYRTANLGKWHLGITDTVGGRDAPRTMGWSYFSGILVGGLSDYEAWTRFENGARMADDRYATSANVDDALTWLTSESSDAPWLLWMAFNAPHSPFHRPPDGLYAQSLDGLDVNRTRPPFYRAMIEALDTEVGRLIEGVSAQNDRDTVVIFIGDNGTPSQVIEDPFPRNHGKDTLFEGGVHVPLCVRGPGVVGGRVSEAMVHSVDLFRTILSFARIAPDADDLANLPTDSESFLPVLTGATDESRTFLYTESFGSSDGGDGQAVRNARYKLIAYASGESLFFDLEADPTELSDLLVGGALSATQQAGLDALRDALNNVTR